MARALPQICVFRAPAFKKTLTSRNFGPHNSTEQEQTLLSNARDGIQLLVNEIWSRPTRIVDDGVVAELPPISTGLPREKPVGCFTTSLRLYEAAGLMFAFSPCVHSFPRRHR